jgi:hypothetical protein
MIEWGLCPDTICGPICLEEAFLLGIDHAGVVGAGGSTASGVDEAGKPIIPSEEELLAALYGDDYFDDYLDEYGDIDPVGRAAAAGGDGGGDRKGHKGKSSKRGVNPKKSVANGRKKAADEDQQTGKQSPESRSRAQTAKGTKANAGVGQQAAGGSQGRSAGGSARSGLGRGRMRRGGVEVQVEDADLFDEYGDYQEGEYAYAYYDADGYLVYGDPYYDIDGYYDDGYLPGADQHALYDEYGILHNSPNAPSSFESMRRQMNLQTAENDELESEVDLDGSVRPKGKGGTYHPRKAKKSSMNDEIGDDEKVKRPGTVRMGKGKGKKGVDEVAVEKQKQKEKTSKTTRRDSARTAASGSGHSDAVAGAGAVAAHKMLSTTTSPIKLPRRVIRRKYNRERGLGKTQIVSKEDHHGAKSFSLSWLLGGNKKNTDANSASISEGGVFDALTKVVNSFFGDDGGKGKTDKSSGGGTSSGSSRAANADLKNKPNGRSGSTKNTRKTGQAPDPVQNASEPSSGDSLDQAHENYLKYHPAGKIQALYDSAMIWLSGRHDG